jgi:3-hydroxy acid dehydrogenase/malonic semialdehyde reductase
MTAAPSAVLVTGASAGFGMRDRPAVRCDRRAWWCARRSDRLGARSPTISATRCSPSNRCADRAAVEERSAVCRRRSPIDVLVNNAGLAKGLEPAPIARRLGQMVDTSWGLRRATRAVLPAW